jgi:hypothetical protein
MRTRSQTKYELNAPYSVNIDFDDASTSWKSNKKPSGNGCYTYICGYILNSGKPCMREIKQNCDTCSYHTKK